MHLTAYCKTWLIMQMTFVLLTVACIQVSAHGFSQITLQEKNAPLEKVLADIEKQTSVSFVYGKELISRAGPVTLSVSNQPLTAVLDLAFKNQPLNYQISESYVILSPKPAANHFLPPTVRGRVTDSLGNALAGASVIIKGTRNGTQTNADGEFELKGVSDQATLVISFTGYESRDLPVNGRDFILVPLLHTSSPLDAVQVIPYGTTTQRLSTGSIATVSGAQLERQPVGNPMIALEGQAPGLVVTQSSGQPGASVAIQIRGRNSLAQGSQPLFVIDGVPFAPGNDNVNLFASSLAGTGTTAGLSAFNNLNTADIESIEILKDADATSIYGSRGANGVVLITTKKGKAGKLQFSASVYSGASRVARSLDMMNTSQYLTMRHEAFRQDSVEETVDRAPDLLLWDTTRYTDLKKLLIGGTAPTTDAQASLSGGAGNTSFFIGAGYHHQGTVFPGDLHDNRGSLHVNLNQSSADKRFNATLSASYASDRNNLILADLTSFLSLPPNVPEFYDSTGQLNWQKGGVAFKNPLAYTEQHYTAQSGSLISNALLSYRLFSGLTIKTSFGYNTLDVNEHSELPLSTLDPSTSPVAASNLGTNRFSSWIIEPQAEYIRMIGPGKLDVLAGGTWREQTNSGAQIFATGFTSDALLRNVGAATEVRVFNSFNEYHYEAGFGRINYNYRDKYILNASGRRDGSSRFGPGKRFGNFGAVGAAWVFSNERFFKDRASILSFGKLRGSYGTSGNDQIGNYQFYDSWTNTPYPYSGNGGLQPARLYNPDYSWEVNKKIEGSVDLGFFKDRLLLSAAYFCNRSDNQLVEYKLPAQAGFFSVTQNFPAVVENKGWELTLRSVNFSGPAFRWSTSFNITIPRNRLVDFANIEESSYAATLKVGQSLSVLQQFRFAGLDPATGIYLFQTKDGPSAAPEPLVDAFVIGNLDPKYYGGFFNSFGFHGLQLDVLLTFKKQLGPNYKRILSSYPPGMMVNQPVDVLDRWQQPGDHTEFEKFTQQSADAALGYQYLGTSDAAYSDASYVRLKNVSLSYTFPKHVRVFLLGQNLLTITHYLGNDPETLNFYSLPPLKTITAGLQFTF